MQVATSRRALGPATLLILSLLCALGLVGPTTADQASAAAAAPRTWQDIGDEGYDHPAADDIRHRRDQLPNGSSSFGNNVAAIYVDVSGLTAHADGVPLKGGRVQIVDASAIWQRKASALGLSGARQIGVVTAVSDPRSTQHSEEKLLRLAGDLLRQLGVPDRHIQAQLRNRVRALVTERSPCASSCSPLVASRAPRAKVLYLVRHKRGGTTNSDELSRKWGASKAARHDAKRATERKRDSDRVMNPEPESGGPGTCSPSRSFRRLASEDCGPRRNQVDRSMDEAAVQNPGGIDFKSISLRYLSVGESDDEGARYAFKSDPTRDLSVSTPEEGLGAAKQASDAFFVWLALSPDTFWVNLKPNEPDRVVDDKLGRTDAGRVLLEADLRLKKSVGAIIHPDSRTGRWFWRKLEGVGGRRCFSSRVWITPGEAKVRADDDELYILDAPLKVQMEQEKFKGTGVGSSCPDLPAAVNKRNEGLYRRLVLPRLVKAVNNAPEYAALRRVYTSRVAAEWYRTRTDPDQSGFADIVGSGDISRWELHGTWSPRSTYQRFLHSYKHGEFKKRQRVIRGNKIWIETMTYGGVVFANVLLKALSDESFERLFPEVGQQVERLFDQGAAKPSGESWMGGAAPASGAPAAAPPPLPELPDLDDLELKIPEMPDLGDLKIPDELLPPETDEQADDPDDTGDEPAAPPHGEENDEETRAHAAKALAVKVAPYSLPMLLVNAGLALLIAGLVRRTRRGVR